MARLSVLSPEPEIRSSIVKALTNAAHEVEEASDTRAASAILSAHAPDVLIADLSLLARAELQAVVKAAKLRRRLKVLAVASGPLEAIAKEFGADDLLQKPFRRGDLMAAVDRLLRQKLA